MRSPDCASVLFGAHLLPANREAVLIVTEGELDVIALWDYGYREGVVSSVLGAGSQWDDASLDLLEPYPGIYLAMDTDEAGEAGAAQLSTALGPRRCHRVRLPRKDAGDCLREGVSFEEIAAALNDAPPMADSGMHKIGSWGSEIERLIANPHELVGFPTCSNALNNCIGGLRPGLMVVTGGSGTGKTTFCTWLLWDQARHNVPILLTALEQGPAGIVQKLLRMELGGDFRDVSPEDRARAIQTLDGYPILLYTHHGAAEFDELLGCAKYARRRFGVRVVLLDHLGYLVHADDDHERKEVDRICQTLAMAGKEDGICFILVVHPAKVSPGEKRRIQLRDAKMSSSIEQESMIGVALERLEESKTDARLRTRVHVDKLRSECGGRPGSNCTLYFDFKAQRYADQPGDLPVHQQEEGATVASGMF